MPNDKDIVQSMDDARKFAQANLVTLATETGLLLRDWQKNGGEGGLLREMGNMIPDDYHSLQIAESIVTELALDRLCTSQVQAAQTEPKAGKPTRESRAATLQEKDNA